MRCTRACAAWRLRRRARSSPYIDYHVDDLHSGVRLQSVFLLPGIVLRSKDVFADLSKRIKDKCLQFNNELNALKTPGCTACRINLLIKNISPNSEHCPRTHFKKPPKKARPPVKDELPNPEPSG